ncbi:restriction endonuclease subunit S [Moraxella sp. FZFQ2102]|nr:restriction endonuclease subunit S [Moraxella sp. FZFQ2102]USZ15278.1 restriction endonuclease subunit S [Moraxella sp. FZFQ2102]
MAQHPFLQNLLNGQAVEWKPLGEVCHSIKTGLNPRQFFQLNTDDATNYYVTIRELQNHQIVFTDKTDKINDEALRLCNHRSNLEVDDILFSGTGTIGIVALVNENPNNWNIKEGVYAIKPMKNKILSKFLLYLFESEKIRNDFLSKSAGGTVKSVPMKELAKVLIPIPPLSVQAEIVQRLDLMAGLIGELKHELNLRQKQYQYYLNKFLTFDFEAVQSLATASDSGRQWCGRLWVKLRNMSNQLSILFNRLNIAMSLKYQF